MTAPDRGIDDVLERLRRAGEELDAMAVQQRAEWDQARAQWADEDEERAKLARRGGLGPQWQRLQQRIDLGETSASDILRGNDDSVDAERVMVDARRRAEEMGAELRERDEQGELPVLNAERAEMAELSAALDDLRRMTSEGPPPGSG